MKLRQPARKRRPSGRAAQNGRSSGRGKEYLTKAALSRLAGVSGAAVTKAVAEGRLVETKRGIDPSDPINKLFVELHRAEDRQRRPGSSSKLPGRNGSRKGGGDSIYAMRILADTELKREQTATHRQRRLERMGLLVEKDLVDKHMAILGNEVKTRLLDLPARIFPQLAALVKSGREEEAFTKLEAEISEAVKRIKEKATA